jgi:cohesin domain-containing protein
MRRPPRIVVLIAVLAATAAWVAFDVRRPAGPAAGKSPSQAAAQDSQATEGRQQPAIPERSTLGRIAADPFSPQSWVLPRKPAAAAAAAPAAPVAPPLPYRFAGQFYRDSGTELFIARGEEIFPIKEGDTLDGQYKVDSVSASEVRFVHLPTGTSQVMQFSALRDQELTAKADPAQLKAPATAAAPAPAATRSGPAQLRWEGPASARAGTNFDVALRVTSGEQIRAAPMQVRFDPAILESVSVRPGRYFGSERAGNFGYRVNPEGSIFIGVSNQNPSSTSDAEMLVLTFKTKRAAAAAEISVASLNLQGAAGRAIAYSGVTPFRTTITP